MEAIRLEHAGKQIRGAWVFRDIYLSLQTGQIHGLIGRNGAGKTMLLKSICGLTHVTEGTVVVNGQKLGKETDIPDSVGALIEVPGFLLNVSGFQNLRYLAGLRNRIQEQGVRTAMERVGLSAADKKRVGKYSLGMRQRLGIAQAIMEDPDILILDEPMNGLDDQGVSDMRGLFLELRDKGKTILLASHYVEDIEELCDTVTRMDRGRVVSFNSSANWTD